MKSLPPRRYDAVAMILHWLMALAIVLMLVMGHWMADAVDDPAQRAAAYKAFQLHKSLGLTLLVLSVLRLAWRAMRPVPEMPATMSVLMKLLARLTHGLLYVLMLALPLSGWLYVSAGWNSMLNAPFDVPTIWFGLFQWPHLPGVATAANATRQFIADGAHEAHELLGWAMIILLVAHVVAALKHRLIDRDDVMATMLPWIPLRAGGDEGTGA